MIAAVRLVVPWALLAVFLVCAIRWRIFLLGIPFLMLMGESVYFDTMKVFRVPGRLETPVLMLLWLVVVWVFATGRLTLASTWEARRDAFLVHPRPFLPEELAVLAFGALAMGHVAAGALRTGDFAGAVGRGLGMLSLVAGYYLVRDIVEHATRSEVMLFLSAVVLANTVATTLFVVHQGLNVNLYSGAANVTTIFEGTTITRAFTFAPPFVLLTTAYVLARRRWTPAWGLVLVITLVGVWVSYTRSLLLIVVAALTLAFLGRQLKNPSASQLFRRLLGISCVSLVLLWGFATVFHAQSGYFAGRLAGLRANPASAEGNSLITRIDYLTSTVAIVQRSDLTFGLGFPRPADELSAAQVESWGADMAWILIVYRTGIAGVVLIVAMCIGFGIRAYRLFMRETGDGEYLGLVFLIAIFSTFLLSFVSRTFVEPRALPLGFWLFAFVAAEARRIHDTTATPAPASERGTS